MITEKEAARYSRQILLNEIGVEGQLKLKEACVLVVGAGGLGCPVLHYLSVAGTGRIGIVDFDRVELSNLQRQILYAEDDIGEYKAIAAARKLKKLNSGIQILEYNERLSAENVERIYSSFQIIVDCTDDLGTRYLINDACVLLRKPMVYAAIHKFQGQISVFNYPGEGKKAVTYRCLFPEIPESGSIPSCDETGVLGVLPGIIGAIQCAEVIKIITGFGEILSGKLFVFDALSMQSSILKLERDPHVESKTPQSLEVLKKTEYHHACEDPHTRNEITASGLQKWLDENLEIQFLDVRNMEEWPVVEELSGLAIPLDEIENGILKISREKCVIVFCKSGNRSSRVTELLMDKYKFGNVFSLKGGVDEWLRFKKTKEN